MRAARASSGRRGPRTPVFLAGRSARHTAPRARDRALRAHGRRQDRRRDRAGRAAARARRGPVAVSADALQVYAGLEILTGARHARRARAARAPAARRSWPSTRRSRPARFAELAHAEIDAALAARPHADRRGRHRALPAGGAHRARAAPAAADRACARAGRPSSPRAGPEALHAELARARRARPRRSSPTDRTGSCARSSCSRWGRRRPRAGDRVAAVDGRHAPSRRCSAGLTMDRDELYERIDARVDAMVAAGAADEVRRADAAGASHTARDALGFEELLRRRRRGDEAAHAQLRPPPAHVDAQAAGRRARST